MRQATCSLNADSEAPRLAREFVREVLSQWSVDRRVIEDAQLLSSEIVINAVMYGRCERTDLRLTLERVLTIGATDSAEDASFVSSPPETGTNGGWGLHLVSTISDAWGTTRTEAGKTVWFSLLLDHAATGNRHMF